MLKLTTHKHNNFLMNGAEESLFDVSAVQHKYENVLFDLLKIELYYVKYE